MRRIPTRQKINKRLIEGYNNLNYEWSKTSEGNLTCYKCYAEYDGQKLGDIHVKHQLIYDPQI